LPLYFPADIRRKNTLMHGEPISAKISEIGGRKIKNQLAYCYGSFIYFPAENRRKNTPIHAEQFSVKISEISGRKNSPTKEFYSNLYQF